MHMITVPGYGISFTTHSVHMFPGIDWLSPTAAQDPAIFWVDG